MTPADGARPPRPFLTAQWTHLVLANFAVPHELLRPRLPPGLELDLREGQPFVSLVFFDFVDTRVLGVPWPGFRTFPEVNLRFYVRHGDERGVVFVREYVPQPLVAWMARTLYNEPYVATPMRSAVVADAESIRVEHSLTIAGREHRMQAVGRIPGYVPGPDSAEHFFKEHHWGFGKSRSGRTLRYHVWHPIWEVYPVRELELDLDWGAVYGPEWAVLQGARPTSTVLAAGSAIAVYPKGTLAVNR